MGVGSSVGDVQFEKLFTKGLCPDIKAMEKVEYERLTGDWFL